GEMMTATRALLAVATPSYRRHLAAVTDVLVAPCSAGADRNDTAADWAARVRLSAKANSVISASWDSLVGKLAAKSARCANNAAGRSRGSRCGPESLPTPS